MTYEESIAWIHSLPRLAKNGDHQRILAVLAQLDDPHQRGHFIHVTGTNGKGSTANAIAHILEASGLAVGLFTSPFIMRFNERIMIDHVPIPDDDLVRGVGRIQAALAKIRLKQPEFIVTEFEVVTVLGFWYFAAQEVDVAVIEVGIGGDTDSTNVLTPVVSVITEVALDHQALLGDTLAEIAHHKAGIIKPQVPVVTGVLPSDAQAVVAQKVQETNSTWLQFDRDFFADHSRREGWGQQFRFRDSQTTLPQVTIPLVGEYQLSNAAIAIEAAQVYAKAVQWPLAHKEIRKGLAASQWPGRLEKVSDQPLIILDGAHNPDGMAALITAIKPILPGPLTVIAGVLADKAYSKMVAQLVQAFGSIALVPVPNSPRTLDEADYADLAQGQFFPSWQAALAAHLVEDADQPILITGSLYLVADVRQQLLGGSEDK